MSTLKKLAAQQILDDTYNKYVKWGYKMPDLIGMYYECIIDHQKNEYNKNKRHFHKVIDARYISRLQARGCINQGISYRDASGAWHIGCDRKYFKKQED